MIINADGGRKADDVSASIKAHADRVIQFKQIEQDRQYAEVKRKVK